MNKTCHILISHITILALLTLVACNPEAKWTEDKVDITMDIETISAGFIECSFSTTKDAYYLVSIQPTTNEYNPMERQKQFMTLALDSAHLQYINWREWLLKEGEFNIAPESSHVLQYGAIDHFFTNLTPQTEYWIYAFIVNPETFKPAGRLHLITVKTTAASTVDVHFEYRVKGRWDYIYPVDSKGKIYGRYPYVASTQDSTNIKETGKTPKEYFSEWFSDIMKYDITEFIIYGVKAEEKDGDDSYIQFIEGNTYYTAIAAWDGLMGNNVIYKFKWTGENFEAYFTEKNSVEGNE